MFDTIDESLQNDLIDGNIYGRGQWTASLRYHDGLFYVFFGTGNKSESIRPRTRSASGSSGR